MGLFGKNKKERVQELLKELEHIDKSGEKIDPYNSLLLELLKLEPKNQKAAYYRGKAFGAKGRYEDAIQCFNAAIQIKPNSLTWWEKGKIQIIHKGYTEDALESFEKALELDPDSLDITASICDYYAFKRQIDEMNNTIDRFLTKNPNNAMAWYIKGAYLERVGRNEEAVSNFVKSKELGSIEAKAKLRQLKWNIKREKEFYKELLINDPEIIGKFIGDFLEPYMNAIDGINDTNTKVSHIMYSGSLKETIKNMRFPPLAKSTSAKIVLTRDTLSVRARHTYSVDLEKIISVMKIPDENGHENSFIIKFGENSSDFFIFRIKENSRNFHELLSKAILIRKKGSRNVSGITVVDFSSIKEYLKNGGVVMQTFKCPGCGASLEFPDNVDTTICQYCGNKIKAVDLFEKIRTLI